MSEAHTALATRAVSVLDKASPLGNVGIGARGALNNTDTRVLTLSKGGVLEAGAPDVLLREADGVVVSGGGRDCLRCPCGRACRKCKAGVYDGPRPSLDKYRTSSDLIQSTPDNGIWSGQQRRGYQRVRSLLQYWQANGFQVLWVMLSTAPGGDARKLADNHYRLRRLIERKPGKRKSKRGRKGKVRPLGYSGLQHYQVRTSEGNGVLHVFWAWRPENGFRARSFYVPQAWISEQWQRIHGAPVVWVSRVGRRDRDVKRVSKYCMAQYVGGQSGYEYMSWSWHRSFGFPLVAFWRAYKRLWSTWHGDNDKAGMFRWWSHFLAGRSLIPLPLSLVTVAQGYKDYGKDYWQFF